MPKNIEIDFKLAYSTTVFKLQVDIEQTITNFILFAKDNAKNILNINESDEIEIVQAGKYNNENGRDPELAPALNNSDYTLYEYFQDDIYYGRIAFYIRIKKNNNIKNNLSIIVPDENNEKLERGTPPPPFSYYDSDDDWDIEDRAL